MTAAGRGSAAIELLTVAVLAVIAATCKGVQDLPTNCTFKFSDITIDLGNLDSKPGTSGDGSEYFYSPCFPNATVFKKNCTGALVCKMSKDFDYTPIGVREISNKGVFNHSQNALILSYEADAVGSGCPGEKQYSQVAISCDEKQEDEFKYADGSNCRYKFTLKTKLACIDVRPPSHGLSTGAILLILLLISVAVYLVGGVLYKRLVKGSRGVEQIPNIEFWISLPGLVADGCRFVTRPCRGTAQYEQI